MKRATRIDCPAKVNLFLEILRRRPDGYHELATVMVAVSLFDTISVSESKRDAFVVTPSGAAPADASNTVLKVLAELRRRVKVPPVRIVLKKRIPSGAGLGGGSSDAAGLVRAVDRHFDLELPLRVRRSALAAVGSDTAFFATGGTALCTGRGEKVEPLPSAAGLALVIVVPPFENPTREVYARLRLPLTRRARGVNHFLNTLASGEARRVGRALFNRLERPAFEFRPELRRIREALADLPFAGARMTGSGSAVFGLCADRRELRALARRTQRAGLGRTFAVTVVDPEE